MNCTLTGKPQMTVYRIHATRIGEFDKETSLVPTTKEEFLVEADSMAIAVKMAGEDERYEIDAIVRVGNIIQREQKEK